MNESAIYQLAGIGVLAIAAQWLAWWVKLPAILFLLLAGIVAGPVAGWLEPDQVFGDLLFPLVSLSVAVILFEGSLTLRFEEIRELQTVVRRLVTTGVIVTWIITALITHYAVGFGWDLAFLFGAVAVVTGPTVIVPMLRTVRPNARIANILRWEGIVIDPIGALLAVLVFEFIISGYGSAALGHSLATFGQMVGIGLLLGSAAGYSLGVVLRRHMLPEYLNNVATLALLAGVFAISDAVEPESGLLTVTVMGIWLANMRGVPVDEIIDFKETLSVLLISALFIILAARIEFAAFEALGWSALLVLLGIQFVARPLKVWVATLGSNIPWRERALLSWIAPRGIVAAAVSALFALRLQQEGFEQASLLVPLTFLIIIGTVVLQSATARPLANWLGVAEPEPKGFLIIGANLVARTIAAALVEKGFRALLTDSNWENIRAARMAGLRTYFGNPVSEHADRHLDLVGIGRMLALSPHRDLNTLSAMRYRGEFGRPNVFSVQTAPEKKGATENAKHKHQAPGQTRQMILFGSDVTYSKLASLISQGAEIRSTQLTANFSFEAYNEKHGRRALPLFAIDTRGRLHLFTAAGSAKPAAGWTIMSLVQPDMEHAATD